MHACHTGSKRPPNASRTTSPPAATPSPAIGKRHDARYGRRATCIYSTHQLVAHRKVRNFEPVQRKKCLNFEEEGRLINLAVRLESLSSTYAK
jgi:hypothetical protein